MELLNVFNQEGINLIDVREPFEFMMGHAEGAVNIPLGSVPEHIEEFRKMTGPVVLYCRSGMRSGQATQYLRNCGVPEAVNAGSLDEVLYYQQQAKRKRA